MLTILFIVFLFTLSFPWLNVQFSLKCLLISLHMTSLSHKTKVIIKVIIIVLSSAWLSPVILGARRAEVHMSFLCSSLEMWLNVLPPASASVAIQNPGTSVEYFLGFKWAPVLFWRIGLLFIYKENQISPSPPPPPPPPSPPSDTPELCSEWVVRIIPSVWEDLFWGLIAILLRNCLWTSLEERDRGKSRN